MSSFIKISLKGFASTNQPSNYPQQTLFPTEQVQQKPLKNQRRQSNRESKNLKLNTLPCQEIEKDANEKFLFRSTWEDVDDFKDQMKGCTSPTFATQILSHAHNHSSLFPFTDQINEQAEQSSKRTRVSNSRSKSKNSKSLQKFIGDNVSTHRPSHSTVQKSSSQIRLENHAVSNTQEMYLYEMKKMESANHELRRENKKLEEKCNQLKQKCQELQDHAAEKTASNSDSLMTNETLLEKMKNESFWKFYLKAQKMIKASLAENNQQTFSSPINFMKELEALREMSSEMKKENKQLRKQKDEKGEQLEQMKDKLSVQEAEVEEMRLKCVAYESSIKRLREQLQKNQKDLEKLSEIKELEQKLSSKSHQNSTLSKQLFSLNQQLQQQKLLNSECQKERLSTKKKNQLLQEEIKSLEKQLSSIKTSYNLLEIQKQEMSANKNELIEKEKLKEKVFQLEKEIKSLQMIKEQQILKMRQEYEMKYGKEIQVKDSRVKELDEKVGAILGNITELQKQNTSYAEANRNLAEQISQLTQQNEQLEKQLSSIHLELTSTRQQKQSKLSELSKQLQTLTSKLDEQSNSLLTQETLIQELKKQIHEKEQLLKVKEYESEKLKASLVEIKEEEMKEDGENFKRDKLIKERAELEEYVAKLEEKHNEALELYETVHNEKVELELQLQYCEKEIQKLTNQLQQQLQHSSSSLPNSPTLPNNDTLELIQSLLTIKEEIIKKILVFCPQNYKELLVEYIYYGDMIKEKYIEIISCQGQSCQNDDCHREPQNQSSQDESYLQVQEDNSNFYPSHQTRRNHFYPQKSHYNKTKPYQSRNPQYDTSSQANESQPQDLQSKEEQINHLLEQFIKIGNIIDEETRQNYQKEKLRKKNLADRQKSREKEEQLRRSKQKEMQMSKNLLNQVNKKISKVKENNMNNENSFHYKLAANQGDKRQSLMPQKQFSEDQKYPTEPVPRPNRVPLQQNDQSNISRPLFTAKDIKIRNPNMRNVFQEQQNQQKSYEGQGSVQKSNVIPIQQTPYQKGYQRQAPQGKNNFNHGVLSKLNMLRISDKIRQ